MTLSRKDVGCMLTGAFLCILFCCWFGHNRIFWEDEMLGWMLLHDPSWNHFIHAWRSGADGGGIAFYLIGRAWFRLFGASVTSFRLVSATCFAMAFCVTWMSARRFYPTLPVAIALFTAWFLCPPMVIHMVEGRFYGLLVLATSLVWWVALKACSGSPLESSLYVAAFVTNGLVCTTHALGVVYSAVLLAVVIIVDRARRNYQPLYYVVVVSSWLLLLPEREAMVASANVGKPWFWTYPPDFIRFVGAFCGFSNVIGLILLILVASLFYTAHKQSTTLKELFQAGYQQRKPVYWSAGLLFSLPLALAVQAHIHGPSFFINRYLLPVNIGLVIVIAEIVQLIPMKPSGPASPGLPLRLNGNLALGVCALALILWNRIFVQPSTLGSIDYTSTLTSILPKGMPVIFEDAWGFTETIGRQHGSGVQYTYLLDWQHSIDPASPRLEVTQYHLMENWKSVGYFSGSIEYLERFLHNHNRFIVLQRLSDATDRHGIIIGNPLVRRYAQIPGASVTCLRRSVAGYSIWLVCTASCAQDANVESSPRSSN